MTEYKIIKLNEIVDLKTPVKGSWEPAIIKLEADTVMEFIDLLLEEIPGEEDDG
jgi:hypothetical protein